MCNSIYINCFGKPIRRGSDFVKEYDYTEADISNIEIISKSYASQFSVLTKIEKEKIVKILFTIPNKLVFAMLKLLEDKFDKIAESIYKMVLSLEVQITKEEVEDLIIDLALEQ